MFLLSFLSRLPFWLLYGIAEVIVWLQLRIRPYRKAVILENLRHSFPEKSKAERTLIMRRYFLNMAYLVVECLKLMTLPKKALLRRVVYDNVPVLEKQLAQHGLVFVYTGHLANWEWALSAGNLYVPIDLQVFSHYVPVDLQTSSRRPHPPPKTSWLKRLRRSLLEHMIIRVRSERFGVQNYAIRDARHFFRHARDKPSIYAMAGDQCPTHDEPMQWHPFLGRPAPFFQGIERLPRLFQAPVFYLDIRRVKRGYYHLCLRLFATPPYERYQKHHTSILQRYVEALETTIRANPPDWTWAHRRWKHAPPPDVSNVSDVPNVPNVPDVPDVPNL